MARKRTNIADDTAILPGMVAEGVVQELAMALEDARGDLDEKGLAFLDSHADQQALATRLEARADETYAANDAFARSVNAKGDKGRDGLYAFMRHWAAADVRRGLGQASFDALPEGFARGEEPAPSRSPGMR